MKVVERCVEDILAPLLNTIEGMIESATSIPVPQLYPLFPGQLIPRIHPLSMAFYLLHNFRMARNFELFRPEQTINSLKSFGGLSIAAGVSE